MTKVVEKLNKKLSRNEGKCKPCPFCGLQAKIWPQNFSVTNTGKKLNGYIVTCWDGCVEMKVITRFITQAVAKWNFRNGKV